MSGQIIYFQQSLHGVREFIKIITTSLYSFIFLQSLKKLPCQEGTLNEWQEKGWYIEL